MESMTPSSRFAAYEALRSDSYTVLASLLAQSPSQRRIRILRNLTWKEAFPEKAGEALKALARAFREFPPATIAEEYRALFVGLGSGELVPYASWYREGTLQSGPLADLRADLYRLGILRRADSPETEDQAGALCEIMALVTLEQDGVPSPAQSAFFQRHLDTWLPQFFRDMQSARSAAFYRTVGLFGESFLEAEREYLHCARHRAPQGKRRSVR